ncbi:MAG: methyltransferase domain-containing protein [Actinomycetota bacterium]
MWDERYAIDDYLFGTEPADFLRREVDALVPGAHALVIADGEGRNSVFLAERGLRVTAMDASAVAIDKARRLAAAREVDVDFVVADLLAWSWDEAAVDVVVGIFFQFLEPDERAVVFEGMARTLRPGGRLLVHGYRPEQVAYGTGGGPRPELKYTEALLRTAFAGFTIDRLEGYDTEIAEGSGHLGMSALIDLVATKPGDEPDRTAAG